MNLEHQDWDTIYVRANKELNKNVQQDNLKNKELQKFSKINKIEKKIESGNLKHDMIPSEFGKIVQKKRLEKNMTQKDLAQKINIPVKIINEIECGKAKHNPQVVSKIKRILNISNK
tara:strand:+ start:527 stop:877 length:351 start_codon:yes stop_codon:yes gene_type:complete